MWAFTCTLALGYANVRGRPDKGKQEETKHNRDKAARQD